MNAKLITMSLLFIAHIAIPIIANSDPITFNPPLPAVSINPVTDLSSGDSVCNNPPASPDKNPCHRAHQLLFNERVLMLGQQDDAVQISVPNAIYGMDEQTKEPKNTFTVKKHMLLLLSKLSSEHVNTIPPTEYGKGPTIVLTYPWQEFSVGTRFKHEPTKDTATHYAVIFNDYQNNQTKTAFISKSDALQELPNCDAQFGRTLFVDLLNRIINKVNETDPNNVIAYVWGGSSFIYPSKINDFDLVDGVYQRPHMNSIYSGYDCSEFIMRMAQIAGINFPWKTSSIIQRRLQPLAQNDHLQNGDIIGIDGHVMVINNIKKHELIEARSYSSGWGCVHRTTLSEMFDGITTYEELRQRYHEKKKIRLKNKQGQVQEKEYAVKLLRLC